MLQYLAKPLLNEQSAIYDTETANGGSASQTEAPVESFGGEAVNLEEMLLSPTIIQLNNPDYYSTVTIKALLKILCDPSLHSHHGLTIEKLECILETLKSRTSNFLWLIVPVFSQIVRLKEMRGKLLVLVEKVIKHCGIYFEIQYIDSILGMFETYAKEPACMDICFQILLTLITFCKNQIRRKLEPLILLINTLISGKEAGKELVKKGILIYKSMPELLNAYLYLVVPFLCDLIV